MRCRCSARATSRTWNVAVTFSYPIGGSTADAQFARTRVLRNQQSTRLRALELQVADRGDQRRAASREPTAVASTPPAPPASLAERRLEAEQSKFEVGLSTNFFVVQAQRDLSDAQNVELRTLTDLQKSLVTFERAQEAPANASSGGGQQTVGQNAGTTGTGGQGGT